MKYLVFAVSLLVVSISLGCGGNEKEQQSKERTISSYFKAMGKADTMLFEVSENNEEAIGDTLPNALFFSQVETRLMNGVPYFDNSGSLIVMGRGRFPLTENIEAYLVDMRQHWYQHQSLFLFDQQKKQFTDRVTVAEFYGGDGGQILTGSWLFDYDGDGHQDLVRHEIEHWLDMSGEEPRDTMKEYAVLLLWKEEGFEQVAGDSAALAKRFPVRSFW